MSALGDLLSDLDAGEASALATDTRNTVLRAFALAEERKGHHAAGGMSLSKMGGCSRDVAFRLAGTEPTDPDLDGDKRQATLGTWAHRGLLPNMRLLLRGARTEVPVTLSGSGLTLPGTVDLWQRRLRGGHIVYDVKTVKEWGLGRVRQYGARERDKAQVFSYALALRQTRQADVRWCVLVYVDRANGDVEVVVLPFGPNEAALVVSRLSEIARWRTDPLDAPRDEDGPGLSWLCDHCVFLRACWGPNARPGDVTVIGLDPDDVDAIAAACAEYDAARRAESEAKRAKEAAKALLSTGRRGTYHGWALGWGRPVEPEDDYGKAWQALAKAGADLDALLDEYEIQMPRTAGRRGAISVNWKGGEPS